MCHKTPMTEGQEEEKAEASTGRHSAQRAECGKESAEEREGDILVQHHGGDIQH